MFPVTNIVCLKCNHNLLTLLNIFVFLMEVDCVLRDVWIEFLDAFAELRKATIGFVMSVRLPVLPSDCTEQLCSHGTDCHEILHLRIFRKSVEKIQVSLKSDKIKGYFTWRPINFHIISRSFLFRMRNVSEKSYIEKKTHILCSVTFFRKSCRLWDKVEKLCTAGQATDYNMAHAHFMLAT
jgi:hypothetical protein